MKLNSLQLGAGVALLLSGFAGQNTLADSYVFVTNTTPQTVSIQVNHTGSRILQQGNQWAQEATQIAPYETKRVLRLNRYSGIKSGQTYNFDTVVTSGSSQVELKQSMTREHGRVAILSMVFKRPPPRHLGILTVMCIASIQRMRACQHKLL